MKTINNQVLIIEKDDVNQEPTPEIWTHSTVLREDKKGRIKAVKIRYWDNPKVDLPFETFLLSKET